jgi:hypothetical protein
VTQTVAPTSTTTVFVHDLDNHIIAELNASGQTLREYIWLGDMPVAVVDNVASGRRSSTPCKRTISFDHLMRPARMTAANASWVWDVIYSPFARRRVSRENAERKLVEANSMAINAPHGRKKRYLYAHSIRELKGFSGQSETEHIMLK